MTASPIACSLEAGDFQQRLAWIAQINDRYLHKQNRDGSTLQLFYDPAGVALVQEMVRKEQACCAFLTFELIKKEYRLELTIRVPAEANDHADILLAPFLGKTIADSDECCAYGCADQNTIDGAAAKPTLRAPMLGALSMTAATGAVACGVCCVLPVVFPAIALTMTGSALAWLGHVHAWATGMALILVFSGWLWIWNKTWRTRARASKSTLILMSTATLAVFIAAFWPRVEPHVIALLTRQ